MIQISVIIPTFNRAQSVGEAISSVEKQTRKADEIIVVDDGSDDGTPEILRHFDGRIRLIRQANQGVSAARNAGIQAASGEWIAFLDSDDLWYPNRLAVLERDIRQTLAGVHVANVQFEGPGYSRDLFDLRGLTFPSGGALLVNDAITIALAYPSTIATAVRRSWLVENGGFDTSMSIHEDTHLFFRLSQVGPWLVTGDKVAVARRLEDGAGLSDQSTGRRVYSATMKTRVFETVSGAALSPEIQARVARRQSGSLFELAAAQAAGGRKKDSIASLFQSARRHPSFLGWAKAFPPLLIGRAGYDLVLRRKLGFYRTGRHTNSVD